MLGGQAGGGCIVQRCSREVYELFANFRLLMENYGSEHSKFRAYFLLLPLPFCTFSYKFNVPEYW